VNICIQLYSCVRHIIYVSFSFCFKGGAQENYSYNASDFCSFLLTGVQNLFYDGQVRDLKSEIYASPMKKRTRPHY
jgi:hypothetical protein